MKIPNILTIGRIIIVPVFVLTFFIPGLFGDLIPFFLFVLASFTDYLDGLLARLFKEESKLGELLDPIADKILVAAALILLVMNGTIKKLLLREKKLLLIKFTVTSFKDSTAISLYFVYLYFISLYLISLYFISLYFTILHHTLLYCSMILLYRQYSTV